LLNVKNLLGTVVVIFGTQDMDIWLGLFTDTHTSCGNIKYR